MLQIAAKTASDDTAKSNFEGAAEAAEPISEDAAKTASDDAAKTAEPKMADSPPRPSTHPDSIVDDYKPPSRSPTPNRHPQPPPAQRRRDETFGRRSPSPTGQYGTGLDKGDELLKRGTTTRPLLVDSLSLVVDSVATVLRMDVLHKANAAIYNGEMEGSAAVNPERFNLTKPKLLFTGIRYDRLQETYLLTPMAFWKYLTWLI